MEGGRGEGGGDVLALSAYLAPLCIRLRQQRSPESACVVHLIEVSNPGMRRHD